MKYSYGIIELAIGPLVAANVQDLMSNQPTFCTRIDSNSAEMSQLEPQIGFFFFSSFFWD